MYNSVLLCRSLYIRLLEKQESGKIKQKVKPVLVDSRNVKVIHRVLFKLTMVNFSREERFNYYFVDTEE